MKKTILVALALLLCVLTAVAVAEPAKSITLSESTVRVGTGRSSAPVTVSFEPAEAADQTVTWKTSNAKIATVDQNGVVTGVSEGKCKITATCGSASASCGVIVFKAVKAITLNKTVLSLKNGRAETLRVKQEPAGTAKLPQAWTSSDESVAKVNKDGKVTAVGSGECTVTVVVTCSDGSTLSASCEVYILTPVTRLSAAKRELDVLTGSTVQAPEVTVTPASATYKELVWSSDDESVATVDENGAITGVKGGTVKIRARSSEKNGEQVAVVFTVNVLQPVASISMKEELRLSVGESADLEAHAQPEDASDKKKTFSSSNTGIATVSKDGKVSAVGYGSCTITCAASDGSGVTAVCQVYVYSPVTGLTAEQTGTVTVYTGKPQDLGVTVQPDTATDPSLTWTSGDESVATVENGVVTPVAPGTCDVACVTNDGSGIRMTWTINVEPMVPVDITAVRREATSGENVDCLFVTPVNVGVSKTVQSFIIHVGIYDEADAELRKFACEWTKTFGVIKPGESGDSGYWHWFDLTDIMEADHITVTVTSVTYTDGTKQTIAKADRQAILFNFNGTDSAVPYGTEQPAEEEQPSEEEQPAEEEPAEEEQPEEGAEA